MTIFSCEHEWEAMLTCIYEAWASKKGQQNIRLVLEPIEQFTLFDEYIHVDGNHEKAQKVMDAVYHKISPFVYREISFCSLAYEPDILDNIYRILLLGFAYRSNVLNMVQYEAVMRNRQIRVRLGKEVEHFKEFIRFHDVGNGRYVAHIEPKSKLLLSLGHNFVDRMPSEHWMIVDDVHMEAIIHPKNEDFYYRKLSQEELDKLLLTEQANDEFTDMWKIFFDSIAIEQRENYRCQRNLFPIWTRKHAVEFNLN